MVPRRVHPSPRRPIRAAHEEIVPPGLGGHAERAQIRGHELQPVALLHPQLPHLPEHRLASGAARERGEDRHLVHEGRHLGRRDLRAHERRGPHQQVRDRLPTLVPQVQPLDARAHPPEHDEESGAGRVHAHVLDEQLAAFREHRGGHEERRAGSVTRD